MTGLNIVMGKFFYYLQTIITQPLGGFQKVIKDKNINTFIFSYCIYVIFEQIVVSGITQRISFNNILITLLGVPIWFLTNYMLHRISRLFSKKGSYQKLLGSFAFISFIISIPTIIIEIFNYFSSNKLTFIGIFLGVLVFVYTTYLQFMALRSIYGVSKQQAINIIVIQFVIFFLLFILLLIIFGAIFFASHPNVLLLHQ